MIYSIFLIIDIAVALEDIYLCSSTEDEDNSKISNKEIQYTNKDIGIPIQYSENYNQMTINGMFHYSFKVMIVVHYGFLAERPSICVFSTTRRGLVHFVDQIQDIVVIFIGYTTI